MKVDVTYRRQALIGAIGPSVWAKLGPEDWFDKYVIVAANSRNYNADFVIDLNMRQDDIEKFTTQNIVDTPQFFTIATQTLKDYKFIVYRPVDRVAEITRDRFIANDISFSRFEDKKIFREVFGDTLPIPKYEIAPMDVLFKVSDEAFLSQWEGVMGLPFVVQDNVGGGGRGTFIIKSIEDIRRCRSVLVEEKKGTHLVISKFVSGIERSTQTLVAKDVVLRGPLQQQLVRNEELLNPTARGGMYFCGGRFISEWSDKVESQIAPIIQKSASVLRHAGYKGMFGIDFIVDEDENVYVIELNARTTGLLPLLNEQTTNIPLYLLHILELTGENYEITAPARSWHERSEEDPGSFVVLFNQTGKAANFDDTITTGNYSYKDGALTKLDDKARWNPSADLMIQLFASDEFPAKPNLKLANIFLKDDGFDDNGTLSETAHRIVQHIKAHVK